MKTLKKSISIILSVMLLISVIMTVGVTAGAASSGNVIYFEKPDDWSDSIYIYYWEGSPKPSSMDAHESAYKLTKVEGNIYSYTCKASFNEFLFDDGVGGHQTVNLKLPGDSYICKVLDSGSKNEWGNFCNNAEWEKYSETQSVQEASVSANPGSCEFTEPLSVKLQLAKITSGTYSINDGEPVSYKQGDIITIGEDAEVGDVITLKLTGNDENNIITQTYKYTKVKTPPAASAVYYDNSTNQYENVYIYAYGTKENAKWPGEKMQLTDEGLYYYAFDKSFSKENIIINNGEEGDSKQQYPKAGGLPIKTGECKMLAPGNQWIDYGTPDSQPAPIAYAADKTSFQSETLSVKIGLKNAVKGTYQIDGGTVFEYTEDTDVTIGQGAIGNKDITLSLTATDKNNITVKKNYTYKKVFKPSKSTFHSESDGHETESIQGYYNTNPNFGLGKSKTITVDGDPSEWDKSMIIAQGVANDDPRVYMPSAMHEQPWDDYALYAAWDDENLYFMWEMANTTYVVSPEDNFAASNEARPWRNSIPIFIALSIDPTIHADGTAWGTDSITGKEFTNPYVWGCEGGKATAGGVNFKTNIDTLIAFDTNNSNGGASIFKADKYNEANGNYMFDYDTAIPIGVTSFEKQDNRNGFKIAHDNGTLSENMFGVGGAKGSHTIGDSFSDDSNWVDFFDLGYKKNHGFIYETAIPLKNLGIDKNYIETKGIGAMQILTYGTSGMDCLPYDPTMQDNADVEYGPDPSTSHEKEDVDVISVPLARIGAILEDSQVFEAPPEVNFGSDKSGTQAVGSEITLKAEAYNGTPGYTYNFIIDDVSVQNSESSTYTFSPSEKRTYSLKMIVTDKEGKTASKSTFITIGDEPAEVIDETTAPPDTTADTGIPEETEDITLDPVDTTEPSETQTQTYTEPTDTEATSYDPVEETSSDTPQTNATNKSNTNAADTSQTDATDSAQPTDTSKTTESPTQTGENTQSDSTIPTLMTETISSDTTSPATYTVKPSAGDPITPAKQVPIKLSLNRTSVTLKAGNTFALKVIGASAKPNYTTSGKVVKVDSNGKITALKKGTAEITVTAGNSKMKCKITVKNNPNIKISGKALKKNKVYKIKAGRILKAKITGKVKKIKNTYKSTDKKTAKIISKKTAKIIRIKAYKKGTAKIKIKVNGVMTFKIKVKVV